MEAKSCITVNCQQRSSGYRDWVKLWLDTASQFPFYWKHSRRLVNCWKSARSANVSRKKNKKQTRHNRLYSNWLCGSIRLPRGHFQRTRQCQDALMHKNEKAIYTTLTWEFVPSNQRVWNKKMRKQKKKNDTWWIKILIRRASHAGPDCFFLMRNEWKGIRKRGQCCRARIRARDSIL